MKPASKEEALLDTEGPKAMLSLLTGGKGLHIQPDGQGGWYVTLRDVPASGGYVGGRNKPSE